MYVFLASERLRGTRPCGFSHLDGSIVEWGIDAYKFDFSFLLGCSSYLICYQAVLFPHPSYLGSVFKYKENHIVISSVVETLAIHDNANKL